jgi:hypothetical protein
VYIGYKTCSSMSPIEFRSHWFNIVKFTTPATLHVLNAAALSKSHAVEHLAADLIGSNIEIAIITEIHFKAKHTNSVANIPGYRIFRRDHAKRRGGGVTMYVLSSMQASIWRPSTKDDIYELMWVSAGGAQVGAIYHQPKAVY